MGAVNAIASAASHATPHPGNVAGQPLSLTGRRWLVAESLPRVDVAPPAEPPGLPEWAQALLARRGISGGTALQDYLAPSLQALPDPSRMADLDAAVDRLCSALASGEPINVWGDYDVDGVCATVVLVDFLRRVSDPSRLRWYIPDRRQEGYGLNTEAIETLSEHGGVLVTADCGITAHAELEYARVRGLDAIVVDHHQVPETLPPARACLDPQRPDCGYGFRGLCATGVAFMLVAGLRRALRARGWFAHRPEPDLRELLDVTALATVADMVPLVETNRVLVAAGLRWIGRGQRVGMQALCAAAGVAPEAVTASDLGFRLGPRINARGRLGHAAGAVELFLTSDRHQAERLAAHMDAANRARKDLEQQTAAAAKQQVETQGWQDTAALVVHDASWHPGVLGLVASRLVRHFHRPAVVVGEGGKGSGRTFEDLNLYEAMASGAALLDKFGGHHAAAGLTIQQAQLPAFREALCAAVTQSLGPPPYVPALKPDLLAAPAALALETVGQIERLGPFGQQNPEPLLVSEGLAVQSQRVVGGSHLKLRLGEAGVDAIGFGLAELATDLPATVDIVYRLERNVYKGQSRMQLNIEDIRPSTGR